MKEKLLFLKSLFFPLTILLLVIPLAVTYFMWHLSTENIEKIKQAKFETLAYENELALQFRMNSYKQSLIAAKGFFEGSNDVDRKEWKAYVEAIDPLKNYPGTNGIGIIEEVSKENLDNYIAAARKDHYPNFNVHPAEYKDHYFIIKYIEPVNINLKAVGLNIAFEKNRFEAAMQAKESGNATITKRILLVQDAEKTPGFLLLLPTYDTSMPSSSAEEKERAFLRWIYAPFIAKNFMKGLTKSQGDLFHLTVYDGEKADDDAIIFSSSKSNSMDAEHVIRKKIQIMEQEWLLEWTATEKFETLAGNNEPTFIIIIGLLFTGLSTVLLIITRIQQKDIKPTIYSQIIPLTAFLVTASAAFYIKEKIAFNEENFVRVYTEETAHTTVGTIQKSVQSRILALSRMADRWSVSQGTNKKEWRADAKNYVLDQPGLKAVEWVDENYYIRWIEPEKGNEKAIGLNILFNQKRKDILKNAAEKKSVTLTPPLDLVQGYKAFISYSPINIKGKHKGFIVGVFSIEELLKDSFLNTNTEFFDFSLSHNGELFYSTRSLRSSVPFQTDSDFTLYDQEWKLTLYPTAKFIQSQKTFLPDLVFVIGLVLALLVAIVINFAQRSRLKSLLIEEKEELLSTFVKYTPAAVAMFDKKLNYIAASDRWYKDYGIEADSLIGKNHYDIFPEIPKNHPEWLEIHKRAVNGEVISVDEDEFQRSDEQTYWLRYELRPWYKNKGAIGGIIMFTEDITERKRMEIMKDEFVSTVSHELRTPMTSIRTALEMLDFKAKDLLDEKCQKYLSLAHTNCVQLADLVDDILDVQKIASGKMTYHMEVMEMASLVEMIVNQYQSFADKYHVIFEFESALDEVYCTIDVKRFNQALANLLSNAAKFSPRDENVYIRLKKKGTKTLEISVEDKGPGIPEEYHEKIFEKFLQVDSSSTRAKGGTGLGLNITKSIIEAFEGTLTFKSKVGKGTTFYFHLPISKKKPPSKK